MADGGEAPELGERLNQHIANMELRLDHMKKMQVALNDLNAVLTPEQKEKAKLLRQMGPGHRGM